MSAYGSYASSTLQQKPGNAGLRKVALTVEQLATALGATLGTSHASRPAEGADPGRDAQDELERALQRLHPIDHVAGCKRANGSSLVFAEDQATLAAALTSGAGAILLAPPLAAGLPVFEEPLKAALLIVNQPRLEFARAARLLNAVERPTRRHPTAFVSVGATLGSHVGVGPFAVIEHSVVVGQGSTIGAGAVLGAGVVVGVDCRIYPRVVIYPGTKLGDRVVVHAGAVLGSDGFGYVRDQATGAYLQFPQQGSLVIEDDVEIGANTTIDRGALEETRIARGAKLDNLVHLGHNVQVGADAILAAQVGVSGSSAIGPGAVLAGQVGIGDHAAVGEGVVLGGQAGVLPHKTLRGSGKLFWGTPAKPVKEYLRELASLRRLVRRGTEEGK